MRRSRDSQGFPAAMDGNSCVLLRFLSGVYLGLTNLIHSQGVNILTTWRYPMHQSFFFKKRHTHLIRAGVAAALLVSFANLAAAQDEGHRWTANVGVVFTPLVGALDWRLDSGGNRSFGGASEFSREFSVGRV